MDNNKVLGEEKIGKLLFKFSMPCVTGLLISALYSIVDQIFIGNSSLGYIGNAATGISFPVICIANAFAWCIGDGAAAFLSICSGRNDSENAHKCVGTGLTATVLISLILTAICLIFARPLMILFGASSVTLEYSLDYFRIIAVFFTPYLIFNVMNSIVRADGSPAYAMVTTMSGAIINIILDPIFIFVFDWGIVGAAAATAIGQTVSFLIAAAYLFRPKTFVIDKNSFKIDIPMLKKLCELGGSTFITQIAIVVMTLLSNITLAHFGELSKYGSDIPISVFSIQTKVYTIVNNIIVGIALGGQPIVGYNFGAGKMDRVRESYKIILKWSLIVSIAATLCFEFCPQLIINIFGGGSELYTEFAVLTFRVYLSLSVITGVIKLSSVFFQSIGRSMEAMVSSIIRDVVCLVTFTLGLCWLFESKIQGTGIYGVLIGAPLSDLVAGFVVIYLSRKFFKNLKAEENAPKAEPVIKASRPGLVITVSRQHGSYGKQIGSMVAEALSVPFYYKEMTALAARESGLADEFVSDINKNSPVIFNQLYLSTNVVQQAVIAQEKIIKRIADEGACVIVGRAADYVLRNYDNVISIFMYAPEEVRIKNIMEMYGDNYEEAKENMHRSDRARASYYRSISGKEWSNIENYDLCIDTSAGKEVSAKLILDYIKNKV